MATGTLEWRREDDTGRVHTFQIPNSYWVPAGKVRLLSPQHWSQTQTSGRKRQGTGETTNGNDITLFWNSKTHTRTVRIDPRDNVTTFHLAPGFNDFGAYCVQIGEDDHDNTGPVALPANLISDDDEPMTQPSTATPEWQRAWRRPKRHHAPTDDGPGTPDAPTPVHIELDGPTSPILEGKEPPNIIQNEEDEQPSSDMAQLLQLHHQYGHLSMRKMQEMANQRIIPKRLAQCRIPTCSACLYAKMTKRRWRDKTRKNNEETYTPTRPGEVVSVDQLVSPTPGLIAQMTGFLTKQRYKYETVYVC